MPINCCYSTRPLCKRCDPPRTWLYKKYSTFPHESKDIVTRREITCQTDYARPVRQTQARSHANVKTVNIDEDDEWADYARRLGIELNRTRHRAGLTQEKLAYAAGLTRYHYQQLEKGESRPDKPANPSLRNILALAQALGVTLEELLPDDVPDLTEGR